MNSSPVRARALLPGDIAALTTRTGWDWVTRRDGTRVRVACEIPNYEEVWYVRSHGEHGVVVTVRSGMNRALPADQWVEVSRDR